MCEEDIVLGLKESKQSGTCHKEHLALLQVNLKFKTGINIKVFRGDNF